MRRICGTMGTFMLGLSIPGYGVGHFINKTLEGSDNLSLAGVQLIGAGVKFLSLGLGATGLGLIVGSRIPPKMFQKVAQSASEHFKKLKS